MKKNKDSQENFSDLDLQALVDGYLRPEDEIELLSRISESSEGLQRLADLKHQKSLLRRWGRQHGKN